MRFSNIPTLAAAALAMLLASPVTAAPRSIAKPTKGELAELVADVSCSDDIVIPYCLAIAETDSNMLLWCLYKAECSMEDLIEVALTLEDGSADELRRRSAAMDVVRDDDASTTTTTADADADTTTALTKRATAKWSPNITLSASIVGVVMGVAAFVSFGGVLVCCIRERSQKRAKRRAEDAKEALLGAH